MAILGVDEVGRGPWAGPLVVGAVILCASRDEYPAWTTNLTDSKKLSAKNRKTLSELIRAQAPAAALGWVAPAELDQLGLAVALRLATRRAVQKIQQQKVAFSEIIIDGTVNFLQDTPLAARVTTLKKADFLIKEVSAASILAKVARDQYMKNLAEKYPDYGFEKHVGYGTAAHRAALERFGLTPEHRLSFRPVAKIAQNSPPPPHIKNAQSSPLHAAQFSPTSLGRQAESAVADFLAARGHRILARNFRTKTYEIDLISILDQKIYFTEVKYRRSPARGGATAALDAAKLQRMRFAAENFLHSAGSRFAEFSPVLAAACLTGSDFSQIDFFELSAADFF